MPTHRGTIYNIEEFKDLFTFVMEDKKIVLLYENFDIDFDLTLPVPELHNIVTQHATTKIYKFVNCNFKKGVNFTNKELIITEQKCSYYFKYCDFNSLNSQNVVFKEKVRFHGCNFNSKVIFNNTTFENLIDFWSSTFYKRVIFYKVNFDEVCVLSSATFQDNVLFTYSKILDLLILRGCIFQKGLDLSLAIIKGDLSVFDIELSKFKSIKPIEKFDNWLEKFDYITSEKGDIFTNNKRETYRIIKSQLISQKNIIDSNKFSYLESRTLRQEIWDNLKKPNYTFKKLKRINEKKRNLTIVLLTILEWFKSFFNYFILTLNRISNRHKTSYVLGIIFTLLIGLLFYYFSLISSDKYCFSLSFDKEIFCNNVNGFFNFMIPTHKFDYLGDVFMNKYVHNNVLFYLSDIIGRILIGYGIYQTINAFRKYSK